ncbi:MAG TPA: PIN domain-containing protein [Thermoanaerobaculia bacterium]|nr:PIN domain-containing protein [Thermoanaerobaculia bacterium]
MRLVVDTNVLVAGILSASGPPGWIAEALLSGEIEPVLDARIRAEYEDVLGRPELSLDPERVAAVLDVIDNFGLEVVAPPWPEPLPDPDDAPFLAVAALIGCPLVTGNIRHFPAKARGTVAVLTPRQLIDAFARRP